MTERRERFRVGPGPRTVIRTSSADAWIGEGSADLIEVAIRGSGADAFRIEQIGDEILIIEERHRRGGSGARVELTVPAGTGVEVTSASGDVNVDVSAGELQVATASGDVRASGVTGDCNIKTGSGDIALGSVGGRLKVVAASGDVGVERTHQVVVHTASGDVLLREAAGEVRAKTASGGVTVRSFTGTDLDVGTVSGDILVGIPGGTMVELQLSTLSGRLRLPDSRRVAESGRTPEARVVAKSVSGDITVERLS